MRKIYFTLLLTFSILAINAQTSYFTKSTPEAEGISSEAILKYIESMEDGPLPADNSSLTKLEEKNSSLNLKPVKGEVSSPVSKKISKKSYAISENDEGINAVSFKLARGEQSITIESEEGAETIMIGSGTYLKNELQAGLPFTNKAYKKVAASGAWINPDEYQVRVYLHETPARVTYTFTFSDYGLTWDSKPDNSLFGRWESVQLVGTIE